MECPYILKSLIYTYLSIRDEYPDIPFSEIHPTLFELGSRFVSLDKLEKNAQNLLEKNPKGSRKDLYKIIFDESNPKRFLSLLVPLKDQAVQMKDEGCELSDPKSFPCLCHIFHNRELYPQYSLSYAERNLAYLEYCKVSHNLRLFNIYPVGMEHADFIRSEIAENGQIVDELDYSLTTNQFLNLIWLYYINSTVFRANKDPKMVKFWTSKAKKIMGVKSFRGSGSDRSRSTSSRTYPLKIIIYRPYEKENIRPMKAYIREKCGKGFDVLHMNDDKMETIQMARTLFHSKTLTYYNNSLYKMAGKDITWFFKLYRFYNKLSTITQDQILLDYNSIKSGQKMELYSLINLEDLKIPNADSEYFRIRHISEMENFDDLPNAKSFYFFGLKGFRLEE